MPKINMRNVNNFILFPQTRQDALILYMTANRLHLSDLGKVMGGYCRVTARDRLFQALMRPEERDALIKFGIPEYLLPQPGNPKAGRPRKKRIKE